MLDMWAEIVLTGHDTKPAASVATVGYNVDLERQKLDFEIRKYEEEKEERKKRYEEEQEERRKRLELEEKQWEEEAEYRKAKLKLQEEREEREREKRIDCHKIKAIGDALRNSLVKMRTEPIDLIPFFDNVDNVHQISRYSYSNLLLMIKLEF